MIILPILAGTALLLVLVALALSWKPTPENRKRLLLFQTAAVVLLAGVVALETMQYLQKEQHVNFGLPGKMDTKAEIWLRQHEERMPARKDVGKNLRIIQDGLAFLKAYTDKLPPDIKVQVDDINALPQKIDHVLNSSEEARYYEAAQSLVAIIQRMATDPAAERAH